MSFTQSTKALWELADDKESGIKSCHWGHHLPFKSLKMKLVLHLSDLVTSGLLLVGCYLHCLSWRSKDFLTVIGSDCLLTLQGPPSDPAAALGPSRIHHSPLHSFPPLMTHWAQLAYPSPLCLNWNPLRTRPGPGTWVELLCALPPSTVCGRDTSTVPAG